VLRCEGERHATTHGGSFVKFSFGNLLRRGSAEVPASGGDNRLAQELVDRGIAAETSGDAVEALRCFRKAVEADEGLAPAHMNLGIALHAAGEFAAAVASYKQAIGVDPEYAAAHYNLALTHLFLLRYSEAETSFRTALRFRADFPEAWVGLADALGALGRDEEALAALDRAIALRSDYVGALLNSIALLQKMGRLERAVANSRRVLDLEPDNSMAQYSVGTSLHGLGRLSEAETSYRRALALKPEHPDAKANLALVLQAKGRLQEALPLLFEVVANAPTDTRLRRILAEALLGVGFNKAGESERSILLSLCMDDNISMLCLNTAIIELTKNSEGFRILQNSVRQGEDPFISIVPAVAAFLREPLLQAGLPRMPIPDAAMEEVLTHMRRCILVRSGAVSALAAADPNVPAEFICAMARQCFYSGYAFFADETELQRVANLREALQDALQERMASPRILESSLVVAALYDSLHTLKGCERLLEYPLTEWSEAFRPLVAEQIGSRKREREIVMQLASITAIDDEISRAVRAQYEENPYPRWTTVARPDIETIERLSSRLRPLEEVRIRPRPVPMLIAGCGTGHHPIQVARTYPDAEILAVDLSLASLAYAARMTERLGISNITYRQADILKLSHLDRRFAVVESVGVLHHLDDPMAGWRILVDLLESDGLMKIALYSEKARSSVRAAREFAKSLDFPLTPQGIRYCRHAIIGLPDGHPAKEVMTFSDFFTLDECRDLILHVQEHQFTLPRIADCLDQLGLQFLGLECARATRDRFREMFPDRDADNNLDAWHQFEETYPASFKAMYTFWCCRK
jgi:tetratricopeptide (TPR) repeat protein/SAM-dependent methyltransferase